MKQLFKRVLSLLLVVCLLCTAIPSALAAEGDRFTDVGENHWAYSVIKEAVDAGYFAGVSDTEFAPEAVLTRAMLVSIMARAAGVDLDDSQTTEFDDVPAGTWYTGAVAWAAKNGVVYGNGKGSFAPNRPATRQETAAIFYRFLKLMGKTLEQKEEEKGFTDKADIADWANDSVKVMQTAGVLSGYPDGTFRPLNYLTRAEAASLLVRFMKSAQEPVEPTEPTEPATEPEEEPIHVTFVTEHCDVIVEGKAVTELTLPEGVDFVEFIVRAQDGYEVYGVTPSSGRMSQTGSNYVVAGLTEDVTITITDGVTQRTVTFNANNGTDAVQVKVPNGQTVEKPADPVKEGDTFLGWYSASGEEWDFTQPVTSNMTLFAYWLNDTYVGATVYVDPVNGKDSNDGQSEETALKTFDAAAAMISPKVTDGTIWIMGTMDITAEETWDLTGRDCVVKRAPSCTSNMFNVKGGSLTLKGITIDGNGENVKTNNVFYICEDGTVAIEDGTVITNCYGSQGGAFSLRDGSTLTMNGGKIVNNTANYTGGAIYISSYDANKCSTFIMNGGEISGNTAGSVGAVINVNGGKPVKIELNGGEIKGNCASSTASNATVISIGDGTTLRIGGVVIRDNYGSADQKINAVTTSIRGVFIVPTADTVIENPIYLNNSFGSSKDIAVMVPQGLAELNGKLPVVVAKEFVEAKILCGGTEEGAYALQQSDVDKVQIVNDIEGAYYLAIDKDTNTAQFALVPSNDIVVYVNGQSAGKDDNDGLTVSTPVKTLDRAKEVLKAQIAAAGDIPEDAKFVISVVGRIDVTTDGTLSFADFGENASRCVIRRDASNTSSYMFSIKNGAKVTLDNLVVDGNKTYLKNGVSSVFSIEGGAQVTAGSGLEVRNFILIAGGSVFQMSSDKEQTLLTVNGGWYHDLKGYNGVFIMGNCSGLSTHQRAKCVVNDCLVENITGTYGTILALKATDVVICAGTFRNINMSNGVGQLACLVGSTTTRYKASLTISPAAEGKKLSYEGGIWLANDSDDDGSISLIEDCYVGIDGPMNQDIVVDGSLMMWGTAVAGGVDGYKLTESDLAHLSVVSGDVLALNTRTNTIGIAKVR